MEDNRTARWLIRFGIAATAYDLAVVLAFIAFGERMPQAWAVPSAIIALVLFAVTHISVLEPLHNEKRPWASFAMIFWILRHIPHWAKLAWVVTLIGVPVLITTLPADKQLDNPAALHLAALGLYFALSSTLIAWAKLRAQRSASALATQK